MCCVSYTDICVLSVSNPWLVIKIRSPNYLAIMHSSSFAIASPSAQITLAKCSCFQNTLKDAKFKYVQEQDHLLASMTFITSKFFLIISWLVSFLNSFHRSGKHESLKQLKFRTFSRCPTAVAISPLTYIPSNSCLSVRDQILLIDNKIFPINNLF